MRRYKLILAGLILVLIPTPGYALAGYEWQAAFMTTQRLFRNIDMGTTTSDANFWQEFWFGTAPPPATTPPLRTLLRVGK